MSVVIKGAKMPKSCNECKLLCSYESHCQGANEIGYYCGIEKSSVYYLLSQYRRPEWCPLEEVNDE